jgi:hypothetical protein
MYPHTQLLRELGQEILEPRSSRPAWTASETLSQKPNKQTKPKPPSKVKYQVPLRKTETSFRNGK